MTRGEEKKPLVTIAMVAYNSEAYIGVAIESALNSSYENFELLIADDNSTDNTWEIIKTYKDHRVRAVRNERNLGEYPNREQCVNLALGEYFIFIDGDDIIYPHGLDFMVRMLDAFPGCGMALMCWFRNNIVFPVVISPKQFYIGEYFGQGFLGTAFSNVLFRTEVLRKAGGVLSKYKSGDNYIRYKIALEHSSLLINDGLTWWRETPGQASQVYQRRGELFIETYRLKFEFLERENCPLSNEERKAARENLYIILSRAVLRKLTMLNVKGAIRVLRNFRIPLRFIVGVLRRPVEKSPFDGHGPAKPYMIPFEQNPYSKYWKQR